jgi:hypothetical protein
MMVVFEEMISGSIAFSPTWLHDKSAHEKAIRKIDMTRIGAA